MERMLTGFLHIDDITPEQIMATGPVNRVTSAVAMRTHCGMFHTLFMASPQRYTCVGSPTRPLRENMCVVVCVCVCVWVCVCVCVCVCVYVVGVVESLVEYLAKLWQFLSGSREVW